ncbi:MAG: hypothetical protein HDR50_11765 [Desulfovibrio sp.]|uniref:hypothetical protein n=1 Tax=Desulfovibrio sp. TaxID=885 RepID=UPI001A771686|nr:hypothetical protein [Desulfovibrio sp.]MBD5418288.1 hypothetical protein [Desulfovibrio sp.]
MGKVGKIRPEQLRTAQKILKELPVKDTRCSREEAAAFLEKDLKRAFRKGYTPKELCDLLKKVGIIIPERLIARYQEPAEEDEENRDLGAGKKGGGDERNSTPQKTVHAEVAKDTTPSSENEAKPTPKPEPLRYGTFTIVSDTPIGEL